jgi:hypothetical protein
MQVLKMHYGEKVIHSFSVFHLCSFSLAYAQAVCYASDDVKEGVAAVREKRKPNFK